MPVDISNIINVQNKTNNNIIINNHLDQRETIPTLNLYQQPIKARVLASTTQQDTTNIESNKQDTNIKDTFSYSKNEGVASNLLNQNVNTNNVNMKKITLFEYIPKAKSCNLRLRRHRYRSTVYVESRLHVYLQLPGVLLLLL